MSEITCGPIVMGFNNKDDVTLRDYFAVRAMQGICSTLDENATIYYHAIASDAYAIADAMLKEREIER